MATLLNPFLRADDANGNPVSGGQLAVFEAGTTTPVTTYSDRALTMAQAQPLIANSAGEFAQSFVAAGIYKIRVSDANGVTLYENDNVRIADRPDDPVFFDTIADLLADTTTYTAGTILITGKEGARYTALASGATSFSDTNAGSQKLMRVFRDYNTVSDLLNSVEPARGVGSIWNARDFRYEEAASGATDHHETTAGGVKLYLRSAGVQYRATGGALFDVITGGATSESWAFNSYINDIANEVLAATIAGGGSGFDEQYIGFTKNRATLTAVGTAQVWPHVPTDNDLSNLRVFKLSTFNNQTTLSAPSDYTAVISGSQVNITLAVGLVSGERLIVEDRAAKVTYIGVRPDYSWIGGGYDNIVAGGVMQSVVGAHHRINGGDHGSIFGGSYGIIDGGSYGLVAAGTNNEIGSLGGVGSTVIGGYRNRVNGGTGAIIGGQENRVLGALAVIVGGFRNLVSGTASFSGGRNNNVPGSDSIAFGDGNTVSGQYAAVYGRSNIVQNDYGYAKGRGGVTSWDGQDVRFAMRDGVTLSPQRQHFYIDLHQYTTSTTSALMELLDGSTGIEIPNSRVWKCKLHVSARGGNLRGATFEVDFAVQRHSTATQIIGTPVITSFIDAGMGTGANAASVSVAINSNSLEITVQPRIDAAVSTLWAGALEVFEVG